MASSAPRPTPPLAFLKVEGLGNDFMLLDRREATADALAEELSRLAALAPALCDRRTGVGADGFLVVTAPDDPAAAAARMIVINHDGSRPEMCGNGLRCVAHHVAHHSGDRRPVVETDDGLKPCEVHFDGDDGGPTATVTVQMGPARDLGVRTPAAGEGRTFAGVSMGNPHAVAFVDAHEDPETLARRLGPALERDPAYPDRTNVEFARRERDGSLTLWVWERGCGITGACGTGACATAAAAAWAHLGPHDEPVRVRLPGGALEITVPGDRAASVVMRGPSRFVFAGQAPATAPVR